MAGSRIQVNKAHKTRFASKSSRNVHKVSLKDKCRISKSDHNVGKGARTARLQRNKMLRDQKRAALLNEKRTLTGSSSPPRMIVLFPLSIDVDLSSLEKDLLTLLSPEGCANYPTVASPEYKIRATVLKAPHGNLQSCIEMAKIADLIAFVVSARTSGEEIDSFGTQCLSAFRAIGLPSTVVLMRDLPSDLKRRHESKRIFSSIASEFPEDCKFFPVDTKDELHKFMWLYKEQRSVIPHWRHQRPYLAAEKIDMVRDESNPGKCTLLLTGYVRARPLSVNQLVHVSGAGDFQLRQIDLLKDPTLLNPRKGQDLMDADDVHDLPVIRSLVPDNAKQELLVSENVPDPLAGEQTWPTEAEMEEAEENQKLKKLKKKALPRGTSEYQAAWILDDIDEDDLSSSDDMDDAGDGMVLDQGHIGATHEQGENDFDFNEDQGSLHLRDSDGETEQDSVMVDGENMTREQVEHEIRKLKEAHAEDQEYPDEVDTPLDIPARKRFAKYRGVKSFRTSSWDPKESLPQEYARIFAFDNFARTQKHVLAKSLELEQQMNEDECIGVGSYARLHIKEIPELVASQICSNAKMMPIITCGLLQHESKMSVLHFSVKKHDSYSEPIKGKEELLFHVGFRQFIARPIYSSDNISSDKHKMERFLHEGRFSVASIYAPISFPPVPLIALKSGQDSGLTVAAVGSLKRVDPDRIILKKITLTGYPQRVSKYKAAVRYMFHNPEDVKWFKPVEVWTKCGRRGRIKEPLGTHGAMKCIFNGVLQQNDTVCMSLYKRAYPKWPEQKFPLAS